MTKQFFSKMQDPNKSSAAALNNILEGVQQYVNSNTGRRIVSIETARAGLSLESADISVLNELNTSFETFKASLESMMSSVGHQGASTAQVQAAVSSGILGSDPMAMMKHRPRPMVSSDSERFIDVLGMQDAFVERSPELRTALEAYDEKENRNAISYTVAYNFFGAKQNDFGEMFYPTVTVSPDQVGFNVSIRLFEVQNDIRHKITGELADFNRRNIIHAIIDPSILRNDQTKLIPVHRAQSADKFVDAAVVVPYTVRVLNEDVITAPLKAGKEVNLIGLSQVDSLVAANLMDVSDSVDTDIRLKKVYVLLKGATPADDEVVSFDTSMLPYSQFHYSVQGNYVRQVLDFTTRSLLVNKNTKLADGSASVLLASVVTDELEVRLSMNVNGFVIRDTGNTQVSGVAPTIVKIKNVDGDELGTTAPQYVAVAAALAGAEVIGYELDTHRTNLNRRQRGPLINTNYYTQVYAVPLRSPFSVVRPLNMGDQTDSSDLAALIGTTYAYASNEAVSELLRVNGVLASYVNDVDAIGDNPEVLGVTARLVRPFHEHQEVKINEVTQSLTSADRYHDISSALVNVLRDMVYRMWRDTGYQAVVESMYGTEAHQVNVKIGCDPYIARYLMVEGDTRTLGPDFNVEVKTTLDARMRGKIFVTFGAPVASEGVVNPLGFGNMAWKPEMTLVLPMPRNGGISKELTVQPSFRHVTHLPILASLEVTGLTEAMNDTIPMIVNNTVTP